MRFVASVSMLSLLCLLASSAFAATHKAPEGLQLTVPDDWSIPKTPPEAFGARSPDGEFGLFVATTPASDIKAGVKALEDQMSKMVKELKTDKGADRKHHGLDTHWMSGKGMMSDGGKAPEAVTFGAVIVKAPTGKIVLVMALGKEAAFEKNKKALMGIFESLKPAKPVKPAKPAKPAKK